MKIKRFLSNNWQLIAVIFLAVVFFFVSASYNFIAQSPDYIKWGSPDENANYVFSKTLAQTDSLQIEEEYNLYTAGLMKPRSFLSDGPWLKPLSFLGMIMMYGSLAKVFGTGILPYLTPIFASLGLIFFFSFIKRIFNKRIAFLSTLILFSFPVYIYYSARSMFHNVLFLVFLIIFLYFSTFIARKKGVRTRGFFEWKQGRRYWFSVLAAFLAGISLGLAVITRTSELLWLLPLLFLMWIFYVHRISITKILLFLAGLYIAIFPMLFANQVIYGSPLQGGYSEMNRSLVQISQAGGDFINSALSNQKESLNQAWNTISDTVFYFGFKPWQSFKMLYYYFADMFYWLFWPAVLGFFILLFNIRRWPKRYFLYIISWLALSTALVLYYGSWKFTDNPNPNSFTIGNSYTRYWLPMYLGAIPLMAIFLDRLAKAAIPLKDYWARLGKNSIIAMVLMIVYLLSFYFLVFGSEEGLYYTYGKFQKDRENIEQVLELTEYNSVIVTQYHDKLLFPERKVINGLLTDKNMNYYYERVTPYFPLYYFNFTFPEKDLEYLNDRKLPEVGLKIKFISEISDELSLYQLYSLSLEVEEVLE